MDRSVHAEGRGPIAPSAWVGREVGVRGRSDFVQVLDRQAAVRPPCRDEAVGNVRVTPVSV